MLYFAYRVLKLTKCGNYRLIFLFTGMNLTILAYMVQLSVYIHDTLVELADDRDAPPVNYDDEYIARNFRVLFMQLTIVVNLNIWVFYFI